MLADLWTVIYNIYMLCLFLGRYYPNANAFVLFSIMAIKIWSMDHRVETKKQIAESGGIESLVDC